MNTKNRRSETDTPDSVLTDKPFRDKKIDRVHWCFHECQQEEVEVFIPSKNGGIHNEPIIRCIHNKPNKRREKKNAKYIYYFDELKSYCVNLALNMEM